MSNTGLVFYSIGMTALITGLYVDEGNELAKGSLFLGGIGATVASIPLLMKSQKSFHKAIWIRNGDVLK